MTIIPTQTSRVFTFILTPLNEKTTVISGFKDIFITRFLLLNQQNYTLNTKQANTKYIRSSDLYAETYLHPSLLVRIMPIYYFMATVSSHRLSTSFKGSSK